jgi:hypothetical protein
MAEGIQGGHWAFSMLPRTLEMAIQWRNLPAETSLRTLLY